MYFIFNNKAIKIIRVTIHQPKDHSYQMDLPLRSFQFLVVVEVLQQDLDMKNQRRSNQVYLLDKVHLFPKVPYYDWHLMNAFLDESHSNYLKLILRIFIDFKTYVNCLVLNCCYVDFEEFVCFD